MEAVKVEVQAQRRWREKDGKPVTWKQIEVNFRLL